MVEASSIPGQGAVIIPPVLLDWPTVAPIISDKAVCSFMNAFAQCRIHMILTFLCSLRIINLANIRHWLRLQFQSKLVNSWLVRLGRAT